MTDTTPIVLAFFNFSGWELAILLVLGLLFFGRRLPELGRSIGKTIVEFKKGLADIDTQANSQVSNTPTGSSTGKGYNAALPSNPQSQGGSQQSAEPSNPYAQNESRPPHA